MGAMVCNPTEDQIILEAKRNCDGFYPINNLLEALECFYLNGFQDEVCGTVDSIGHYYRVSRWIVSTDSQGFHEIMTFPTDKEAAIGFGKIQYSEPPEIEPARIVIHKA
jgi:hypothetical protein